ncbi:MAG: P1 family peptidase [SAR324 cluster bacterium]|nr:P1 family peptidase [SAR324 cluster bacterium]
MIKPGPKNLITDVPGIKVGNAVDDHVRSGVTMIFPDMPAVAAADVRGGGPGTRETDALKADCTVERIHAIVFSGGSAYGLAAADGVMSWLAQRKIGFQLAHAVIPIVPSAILFDLLNGGDKNWGKHSPYFSLGFQAAEQLAEDFELGNTGAGLGAHAGPLKGGLGSASFIFKERTGDSFEQITVGAIVAVNSAGAVTMPGSPVMWAAPYEQNSELGGQPKPDNGYRMNFDYEIQILPQTSGEEPGRTHTTLAAVATDADLTKAQAKRVAVMAQDGLARAIRPVHSPLDGDSVFVLSTGRKKLSDPAAGLAKLGMLAADCVTRAIARGVYEAKTLGQRECYQSRYGQYLNKNGEQI